MSPTLSICPLKYPPLPLFWSEVTSYIPVRPARFSNMSRHDSSRNSERRELAYPRSSSARDGHSKRETDPYGGIKMNDRHSFRRATLERKQIASQQEDSQATRLVHQTAIKLYGSKELRKRYEGAPGPHNPLYWPEPKDHPTVDGLDNLPPFGPGPKPSTRKHLKTKPNATEEEHPDKQE